MPRLLMPALLLCLASSSVAAQDMAVAGGARSGLLEQVSPLRPEDSEAEPLSFIGAGPAIIVFADAEDDPFLVRQLAALAEEVERLAARDVVLLIDAAPSEEGPLRQKFRPSGFRVVLLDAEGDVVRRRPSVTTARWLIEEIDEMP